MKQNQRHLTWKPPHEDWMKIHIDTSRIQSKGQLLLVMLKVKQMGACPILVAECLTVRETIIMTNSKESSEDHH